MSLEMIFKELITMCSLKGRIVHCKRNEKYGERMKKMPNYMLSILARRE